MLCCSALLPCQVLSSSSRTFCASLTSAAAVSLGLLGLCNSALHHIAHRRGLIATFRGQNSTPSVFYSQCCGKNNSHAVEMAEQDPLLHAQAQRSTPNSEPRALTFRGLNSSLCPAYVAKQGYRSPKRKLGIAILFGKNNSPLLVKTKNRAQKTWQHRGLTQRLPVTFPPLMLNSTGVCSSISVTTVHIFILCQSRLQSLVAMSLEGKDLGSSLLGYCGFYLLHYRVQQQAGS